MNYGTRIDAIRLTGEGVILQNNNFAALADAGLKISFKYIDDNFSMPTTQYQEKDFKFSSSGNEWYLGIFVRRSGTHNMIGYTVEEYRQRIEEIADLLYDRFGIHINHLEAIVTRIEIQRTFSTQYDFSDYLRVFRLLFSNLGNRFTHFMAAGKKKNDFHTYQGEDTLYAFRSKNHSGGAGVSLKCYNKTQQLKDLENPSVNVPEESYTRWEWTINSTRRVRTELGTNSLYELTQDMIESWFDSMIKKCVTDRIPVWERTRDAKLAELFQHCREHRKNHWIEDSVQEINEYEIRYHYPLVLEMHEIRNGLRMYRASLGDAVDRFWFNHAFERFREKSVENSILFYFDHAKLDEIVARLTE